MPNDAGQDRSPADIRAVFSQNLKELMGASPNVSALCRELSLNRTQFNRYLAGESFPRPDILQKICLYFGLDARILLQPFSELKNDPSNAQAFYGLHEFLNMRPGNVPEHLFPSGFYVFLCVFAPQLYLCRHVHPRHRTCLSQGRDDLYHRA